MLEHLLAQVWTPARQPPATVVRRVHDRDRVCHSPSCDRLWCTHGEHSHDPADPHDDAASDRP